MRHVRGIDRFSRRSKCLSNNVPSVQSSPRIRVTHSDERVGAVGFEGDEVVQIHVLILPDSGNVQDHQNGFADVTLDFEIACFVCGEDERLLFTGLR